MIDANILRNEWYGRVQASLRRNVARLLDARFAVATLVVVLGLAIYGLSSAEPRLADAPAPLFLLVVPLAIAAIAYGVRGGVGFGLVAAGLGCAWWLQHGHPGGAGWLVSRAIAVLFVGGLLGWFADSRVALTRELEKQRELSLDLIATASFDGFFTRVNSAFTRTLGYMPGELLATPCIDLVHPADRAATLAARDAQIETGVEILNLQNRYRAKDGSYRWLEWTSRPDPSRRSLIGVGRDITDRKLLEERQHDEKERLEQTVAERTRQLEEARQETVERLALAADYHDDQTQQHTRRVGITAAQIAAALGLDNQDVELIREAALLHDVGKVGITDSVLLKPGRLTPAELEHVKQHAEMGARILSQSRSHVLMAAEEIARFHHERWDGTGYPHGLEGEAIPLFARIVAVADVFDAITHTRPYKEAGTVGEASVEIRRLAGSHFDPAVVRAFETLDPHELAGVPPADPGSAPRFGTSRLSRARSPAELLVERPGVDCETGPAGQRGDDCGGEPVRDHA